jgi:hypothetical protein
MDDLVGLLDTTHFRAGLRLGLVALGVGWALRFVVGRTGPPLPIAGLLIAIVTVASLFLTEDPLGPTLPALVAIVVGVFATRMLGAPGWAHAFAAVPGAAWLAFGAPVTTLLWVKILMLVLIPVAGYLITDFELRHASRGLGVIFFVLAALGMFAAVPDTEQALVIGAASVTIGLLAWPKVAASMGPEGAYVAVAMLVWIAASGGEARPPSIVGSAACLGFLLLEPVLVRWRPALLTIADRLRRNWLGAVQASIPQFILVVICSRIAARFSVMLPAILIVIVGYGLAVTAAWYAARKTHPAETAVASL